PADEAIGARHRDDHLAYIVGSAIQDESSIRDYACTTSRAIISPIASEAVAAGLGALSTCTAPGLRMISKSCTTWPARVTLCARTPVWPRTMSFRCSSGTSRWSAWRNIVGTIDRATS